MNNIKRKTWMFDECQYLPKNTIDCDKNCINNFKCVSGPCSFYYLKSSSLNTTICLFGDVHGCEKIDCADIYLPDFLELIFLNNLDKKFDLFVELPYSKINQFGNDYWPSDNLLFNLRNKFLKCSFE